MTRFSNYCGLSLLALALLVGCRERGPELFPVRGTVTLDGKPLAEGSVNFITMQSGTLDTLPVKGGRFEGKSLAGERRVEVVAYRLIPVPGEMGGEVQESLIAERYNTKSELTAVVSPTGPNEFKFEVASE